MPKEDELLGPTANIPTADQSPEFLPHGCITEGVQSTPEMSPRINAFKSDVSVRIVQLPNPRGGARESAESRAADGGQRNGSGSE